MPRDVLRAIVGPIKSDSPKARSEEDERTMAKAVDYEYEIWREIVVAKTQQSRNKSTPVASQPKSEQINIERQAGPPTRRVARRRQYARIQNMYSTNRRRCADEVLSGDWAKSRSNVPDEEQESF